MWWYIYTLNTALNKEVYYLIIKLTIELSYQLIDAIHLLKDKGEKSITISQIQVTQYLFLVIQVISMREKPIKMLRIKT